MPSAFKCAVSKEPRKAYRIPKPSDITLSMSCTSTILSSTKRQTSFKMAYLKKKHFIEFHSVY